MRAMAARASDRRVLITKCLVERFFAPTIAAAAASMLLTVSALAAPPAAPAAAPSATKPPAAKPAATTKLAPADIQSTFFDGKPFTATTPSSVKFKMTFTADGKMKRQPIGTGNRGEGTWKLSEKGFCTSWKGGKDSCFTVAAAGDNKWSVLKGSTIMATWSK
jgi:hypothetical protein